MIHSGMEVDALLWVLLPVFVAAGSALLAYAIMQARLEVAVARERAILAEANATVNTYKITMEERIRATGEETRRKALNEFMQEFRVEERHYTRENRSAAMQRKTMVMQERLYFRNIPLSNWVEHEMTLEENTGDVQQVPDGYSMFPVKALVPGDNVEESSDALSARLIG